MAAAPSVSAPSLPITTYDSITGTHPIQNLRSSHSCISLTPNISNMVDGILPVKTLYHAEPDQGNGQDSRNGHILGANVLGNESNHPNDGNTPLYDAHFSHNILPDISHGGMQDPLRQWTPLPAGNVRSNFYFDQDTGQTYAPNSRLPGSPGTLDVYPQPNVFPTLTNMSDNGPSSIQAYLRGDSRGKQADRIALPSLQGYQRSQSFDMSSLGARPASTLSDATVPYHSPYKSYSWAVEPSVSAPVFTFKSPQLDSPYSRRGSPPSGQPSPARSFPTGFSGISTGYTSFMFPPLPPTSTSTLTLECEGKRDSNCEIPKGGSSDSMGSSVPASPYSSSPTSSLYGTTRSQPQTPVSMFPSDKGLNTHSSHRRQLNKIY